MVISAAMSGGSTIGKDAIGLKHRIYDIVIVPDNHLIFKAREKQMGKNNFQKKK